MPNDTTQQPISDDQELAKVLAGISQQDTTDEPVIETALVSAPADDTAVLPQTSEEETSVSEPDVATVVPEPTAEPVAEPVATAVSSDLNSVKTEALNELRPLVDKLEVGPEEKFDTYLLLLRSTDDRDLIAPAHEAAKNIPEESRRAQALLDIIKEIDFLSQNQK